MKWIRVVFIAILVVIIVILYFTNISYQKEAKENANLVISLNDTLKTWKDKDSLSHTKIQIIETERTKDFLSLQSKDEEIIKLQKTVKQYEKQIKNQGSVTNFTSETKIITKDSLVTDSVCGKCSFHFSNSNPWYSVDASVSPTETPNQLSLSLDLKVKNEYSVIVGEEKQGLFKKPKPFVEVLNHNPYSETESLRTYQVSNKVRVKRFGIGPNISVGFNDKGFSWFIGIGLQYNLIRF
ncbi:MAG TPA: hypothetical protein PLG47_00020 [Candidatus Dojkabacteria bacterium]|nr:hypothetical protein [Candidatus Dojkabacteria bacterium]